MKQYTFKTGYKFEAHGRECLLLVCDDGEEKLVGVEYRGEGKAKQKVAFLVDLTTVSIGRNQSTFGNYALTPCGMERFRADKAKVLSPPFGSKDVVGVVVIPPVVRRRR